MPELGQADAMKLFLYHAAHEKQLADQEGDRHILDCVRRSIKCENEKLNKCFYFCSNIDLLLGGGSAFVQSQPNSIVADSHFHSS